MPKRILSPVFAAVLALASAASLSTPAQAGFRDKQPPMELVQCVKPIGTAAVLLPKSDPGVQPLWTGMGLGSPEAVIRSYITRSKCFVIVDRGDGLELAERERMLAAAGQTRPRSNIGKGQIRPADYVLQPNMLSGNSNASGSAIGGIAAMFLPGTAGAFASRITITGKTADVTITVMSVRTTEATTYEGKAKKTDLGWDSGGALVGTSAGAALAAGGYTNTELGQVTMAAYMDAFNQMVRDLHGDTGTAVDPSAAAGKAAYTATRTALMRSEPRAKAPLVRSYPAGTTLYPAAPDDTGQSPETVDWIKVTDGEPNGYTGWVYRPNLSVYGVPGQAPQ